MSIIKPSEADIKMIGSLEVPAVFASGAIRSERKPRYDLIRKEFLEGLALTLTEGAEKYGDHNWKQGGEDFVQDTKNHLFAHVLGLLAGDESEDHLHHAAANLMFLGYFKSQSVSSPDIS